MRTLRALPKLLLASLVRIGVAQAGDPAVTAIDRAFVAAFGADFALLGADVRELGGERFWLAHVEPTRPGRFTFRHGYDQELHGYRVVDWETQLLVGERGCARTLRYDLVPQSLCVGDRFTLPVLLDETVGVGELDANGRLGFMENRFGEPDDTRPVDNPVSEHLAYLGRSVQISVHRDGRQASGTFVAWFRAVAPGRFNVVLSADWPANGSPSRHATAIVIVPAETPVHALASLSNVRRATGRTEPASGTSSWVRRDQASFVLRPGDSISLVYGGALIDNSQDMRDAVAAVVPVIERQPFAPDRTRPFADWLLEPAADGGP